MGVVGLDIVGVCDLRGLALIYDESMPLSRCDHILGVLRIGECVGELESASESWRVRRRAGECVGELESASAAEVQILMKNNTLIGQI